MSQVTDMYRMFYDAKDFNQPLEKWDVSQVTKMTSMFAGAESFNQPLEKWDVSNVTEMSSMFHDAKDFNQPLEKWDVSQVTKMTSMFAGAESFNQPLEKWDVSQVTHMSKMFAGAISFAHQAPKRNSSAEEGFKSKVSSIKDFCTKLKQLEDNGTETDEILISMDKYCFYEKYELEKSWNGKQFKIYYSLCCKWADLIYEGSISSLINLLDGKKLSELNHESFNEIYPAYTKSGYYADESRVEWISTIDPKEEEAFRTAYWDEDEEKWLIEEILDGDFASDSDLFFDIESVLKITVKAGEYILSVVEDPEWFENCDLDGNFS
jgi:surface protein